MQLLCPGTAGIRYPYHNPRGLFSVSGIPGRERQSRSMPCSTWTGSGGRNNVPRISNPGGLPGEGCSRVVVIEMFSKLSKKTDTIKHLAGKCTDALYQPEKIRIGQNGVSYSVYGNITIRGNGLLPVHESRCGGPTLFFRGLLQDRERTRKTSGKNIPGEDYSPRTIRKEHYCPVPRCGPGWH